MIKGSTLYTAEQDKFLIENYMQYVNSELAKRFNMKFKTDKTKDALVNRLHTLGYKKGVYIRKRNAGNIGVNISEIKKKARGTRINGYKLKKFYPRFALYEKQIGEETIRTSYTYWDLDRIF